MLVSYVVAGVTLYLFYSCACYYLVCFFNFMFFLDTIYNVCKVTDSQLQLKHVIFSQSFPVISCIICIRYTNTTHI